MKPGVFMKRAVLFGVLVGAIGCGGNNANTSSFGDSGSYSSSSSFSSNGAHPGSLNDASVQRLVLPTNRIFFSVQDPSGNVLVCYTEAKDKGSTKTTFVTIPVDATTGETIVAFAPDPIVPNSYLFAYRANAKAPIGLYKNSSLSMKGATEVVAPAYSNLSELAVTPDGKALAFAASVGTDPKRLYRVATAGSTPPVPLDVAEQVALSPKGDQVAYVKEGNLWVRPLIGKGEPRQLTKSKELVDSYPSFSRDGSRLVYSESTAKGQPDLYTIKVSDGSDVKRLTETADVAETGASFNGDATKVAYAAIDSKEGAKSGLYVIPAKGGESQRVLAEPKIGFEVYWTANKGNPDPRTGFELLLTPRVGANAEAHVISTAPMGLMGGLGH
jgi:hypothetical protein